MVGVVACGYDSHTPCQVTLPTDLLPNASIASLGRYASTGESLPEGTMIVGVVVANDVEGNFYRSIVVEDATGGVEVSLGLYDLAALYPLGSRVAVDVSGLAVLNYNGVNQLGRAIYSWSDYRVEPLTSRKEIFERVIVVERNSAITPTKLSVGELQESMCGSLVRLGPIVNDGSMEGDRWGVTDYGSEADRLFVESKSGLRVIVRTSRYADFAELRIPDAELSITGILYRDRHEGEDVYVIKPRMYEDIEW